MKNKKKNFYGYFNNWVDRLLYLQGVEFGLRLEKKIFFLLNPTYFEGYNTFNGNIKSEMPRSNAGILHRFVYRIYGIISGP